LSFHAVRIERRVQLRQIPPKAPVGSCLRQWNVPDIDDRPSQGIGDEPAVGLEFEPAAAETYAEG
jgi:hypothetical protein